MQQHSLHNDAPGRTSAGSPLPDDQARERSSYGRAENATWRAVWSALLPLHRSRVVAQLAAQGEVLGLFRGPIPTLTELNDGPLRGSGFRLEPVAGLVPPRTFFRALARGVFLSTQFIRSHENPLYTPEPDVVHELVGHVASLTVPWIAELSRAFGRAGQDADDRALREIERLYWFTLEFGLVQESLGPRALGAGLLSSASELADFDTRPELRRFDPAVCAATEFVTDRPQPLLFVADSVAHLRRATLKHLGDLTR